ncbi:MAG: RDD family protein [Sideroxyarcus sp.]|nr:RDD family protein [Sideroxyarcus sp.]
MAELKIKNYDVFIVRVLQIILSFLISYLAFFLIVLAVDRQLVKPAEYFEHIFLFDAKPIALAVAWSIALLMATILIIRSSGQKIKASFVMQKWMGLKMVVLSAGQDFDANQPHLLEKSLPSEMEQLKKDVGNTPEDASKSSLGGSYHPWRRFFARTVDLMSVGMLIYFLFVFAVRYMFPENIGGLMEFITNPIGAVILIYSLWLPVEALFLSLLGTTPAKWIFGIRVVSKTGKNLSYADALKRAVLAFTQGDGLGIPLVTIFTRLYAYQRLTITGTTLWDTSAGSEVTHKKWGVIRATMSVFVTFVALVIMAFLSSIGKT